MASSSSGSSSSSSGGSGGGSRIDAKSVEAKEAKEGSIEGSCFAFEGGGGGGDDEEVTAQICTLLSRHVNSVLFYSLYLVHFVLLIIFLFSLVIKSIPCQLK